MKILVTVVAGRTLDAWAKEQEIPYIDYLWVDVEGASHLLIDGAQELLKRTRYFQIEAFEWVRYEGELLKGDIRGMLSDFDQLADFGIDLLFKNRLFDR